MTNMTKYVDLQDDDGDEEGEGMAGAVLEVGHQLGQAAAPVPRVLGPALLKRELFLIKKNIKKIAMDLFLSHVNVILQGFYTSK